MIMSIKRKKINQRHPHEDLFIGDSWYNIKDEQKPELFNQACHNKTSMVIQFLL
jgi:hypothetical protein